MTDQAPPDIVEQLRAYIPGENDDWVATRIAEAADEIERLRALTRPPSERPVAQVALAGLLARLRRIPDERVAGDNAPSGITYGFLRDLIRDFEAAFMLTERPVAQVREALDSTVRHYIESAVLWMPSEGTKGRNGLDANETIALLSKRMCAALTAERPEAAVAWRWRRKSDGPQAEWSLSPHAPREFHTVGLEVEPLYAIQHEEPGRETLPAMIPPAVERAIDSFADETLKRGYTSSWWYGELWSAIRAALTSPNHSPPHRGI